MCHNLPYLTTNRLRDGGLNGGQAMRILVLGGDSPDLAAIENAFRLGDIEILAPGKAPASGASQAVSYSFAGWTPPCDDGLCIQRQHVDAGGFLVKKQDDSTLRPSKLSC